MFSYIVWSSSKVVIFILPYTQTATTVDCRLQCLSRKRSCSSKILRVLFFTEVGFLLFVITPKIQKPVRNNSKIFFFKSPKKVNCTSVHISIKEFDKVGKPLTLADAGAGTTPLFFVSCKIFFWI